MLATLVFELVASLTSALELLRFYIGVVPTRTNNHKTKKLFENSPSYLNGNNIAG